MPARGAGGQTLAVQPRTLVLVAMLAVGILLCELGVRPTRPSGQQARQAAPRVLEPALGRVRATPAAAIGDPAAAAVVSGIVFGRTDGITPRDRARFQRSGLWHLLAASGQNVALVVGMCVVVAWMIGAGRMLGCCIALLAVPAYVLLVGGGASIVRAGLMGELALVAWMSGRLRSVGDAMVLSATVLVWWSPGVHRTLGFQLSYACVAALVAGAAPLAATLRRRHVPRVLAEGVAATVLCSAATAPLLRAQVGEAPLAGTVTNLVAVPLASVVLVVGLVAALVGVVAPVVALPLFALAGQGAHALLALASVGARMPFAATSSWPTVAAMVIVVGGAVAGARMSDAARTRVRDGWRSARPESVTVALAVSVAVGVACTVVVAARGAAVRSGPAGEGPRAGELHVTFLDVGQGDATLIEQGDDAVLVDTGPPGSGVVRSVRRAGVDDLDGLVLTHDQEDHAGEAMAVLDAFAPRWVAVPAGVHADWEGRLGPRPPMHEVCSGATLRVGDATVSVRNPPCARPRPALSGDAGNDNAIVLVVSYGAMRVLLTADAESPVTRQLDIGTADVLKVAHHGSEDPLLPVLLAQLHPWLGVISVGDRNTYGHPRPQVLGALEQAGTRTLRTDRDGTVRVASDGTRTWVETARG